MNALVPWFRRLSPAGRRARLSILIFHRVLPTPDPVFPDLPDALRFGAMLDWLKSWFNVMPLDQAARQLAEGTLPERAAAITFDDGYADNESVALRELQRRGIPATFFISTGFLDGGRMWNDTVIEAMRGCSQDALDLEAIGLGRLKLGTATERRAAIEACIDKIKYLPAEPRREVSERIAVTAGVRPPTNLMMTTESVRRLHRAGMQIGAHTITHPILARLSPDEARREMVGSRDRLEEIVAGPITAFAYPNGRPGDDYGPEHAGLAREIGFEVAVSTARGAAGFGADPMQLPRFTPWDRTRLRFGVRLLSNLAAARRTSG